MKKNIIKSPWKEVYQVSDVWWYIMEFIPSSNLFRTFSVLDKSHHELIHSPHTYAHILVRDFIEYDVIPKFMVKKILAQFDYKRCLSKMVNSKVKVMKFSKKDRTEISLSTQEVQGVKKAFQKIYLLFSGLMNRILDSTLTDEEHRLFYLGEQLERVLLPMEIIDPDDEEEEDDDDDYFEEYFEIVEPIKTPKHAVTQIAEHAFAERRVHLATVTIYIYFCTCGLSYCVNARPSLYYQTPTMNKDGQQKILYEFNDEESGFCFVKKNTWKRSDYDIHLDDIIIPFEYKKTKE